MMASVLTREACLMHREPLVAISRTNPSERDPGTRCGKEQACCRAGGVGWGRNPAVVHRAIGADGAIPRPAARRAPRRRDGVAVETVQRAGHP